MTDGTKAFAAALCLTLGVTLEWAIYPAPAVARTGIPSGQIIIVYRDAVSNVRQLKGTAPYEGFLGRNPIVSFKVTNDQGGIIAAG